jgi:hypothetical protein
VSKDINIVDFEWVKTVVEDNSMVDEPEKDKLARRLDE